MLCLIQRVWRLPLPSELHKGYRALDENSETINHSQSGKHIVSITFDESNMRRHRFTERLLKSKRENRKTIALTERAAFLSWCGRVCERSFITVSHMFVAKVCSFLRTIEGNKNDWLMVKSGVRIWLVDKVYVKWATFLWLACLVPFTWPLFCNDKVKDGMMAPSLWIPALWFWKWRTVHNWRRSELDSITFTLLQWINIATNTTLIAS